MRQWSTLTDGRGKTTNHLIVSRPGPEEDSTIHIVVWPFAEPEAVLEVKFAFGMPNGLADATDEDGNTLFIVNPRDGLKSTTTGSEGMYGSYIGYTTSGGQSIAAQEIQTVITSGTAPTTTQHPETRSPYTKVLSGFKTTEIKNKTIKTTAEISGSNGQYPLLAYSNYYCEGNSWARYTYDMLFPRDGMTLLSGQEYPLRTFVAIPFGGLNPALGGTTKWSILSGEAIITPEAEISNGVAEGTIIGARPSNGGTNIVTIRSSGDYEVDYVDATYYFRADSIAILAPDPGNVYEANTSRSFTIVYTDGTGQPIEGAEVFWFADERHSYFEVPITKTDAEGKAYNILWTCNVLQGDVISVPVTISTDQTSSENIYRFGANKLVFTKPETGTISPLQEPVEFNVRYLTYDDRPIPNRYIVWDAHPNPSPGTFELVYNETRTGSNGSARNAIIAETDITISLTCTSENKCEPATTAPFTFGQNHLTIRYPKPNDVLKFDTWIPVTAEFLAKDYSPVKNATLDWSGGDFESPQTTTDGSGISTNRIRVETLDGYPPVPIVQNITVTSPTPKASTTQPLTFYLPADSNSLVVLSPAPQSTLPFDQWIVVTAQLQNTFNHGLANYELIWSSDDGILFNSPTSITDSTGKSSVSIKLPSSNGGNRSASLSISSSEANTSDGTVYNFAQQPQQNDGLICDKTYAYNFGGPGPTNHDQIIQFTYKCMRNGLPSANTEIKWNCFPNTTYLYYMNDSYVQIEPDERGYIILYTNEYGVSTLNISSRSPYTGTMHATPPNGYTLGIDFTVATISLSNNYFLAPAIRPQNIDIPSSSTGQLSFNIIVPPANFARPQDNDAVIIYIKSGGQESIIYNTYLEATSSNGVSVPYSMLQPDNLTNSPTTIAYWIQTDLYSMNQSDVVQITVTGSEQRPGPDPTIIDRPLMAPYLNNHTYYVNGATIMSGLAVYIPYDSNWKVGDTINGALYLNGYAGNTSQPKWATVLYSGTIDGNDILSGQPLTIIVPQDQLEGYGYPSGAQPGTLESDYNWYSTAKKTTAWSAVLRDVKLDTASLG